MEKVALIDGDSFVYRAGFAVEKTKYGVSWVSQHEPFNCFEEFDTAKEATSCVESHNGVLWKRQVVGKIEDAQRIIDEWINTTVAITGCTEYRVFLSPGTGNFRESIATVAPYKGNRHSRSRPFYYSDLRDYLGGRYYAMVTVGEEADDRLSYAQHSCRNLGIESIVVGHDKDLLQIPGKHYDYVEGEIFEISDHEAKLSLWMQVLMGDPGDNVPGCYGVGFQKAKNRVKKWIEEDHLDDLELWDKALELYVESQKKKDCPYRDKDAYDVLEETYWLVRLKQTPNEMNPWTSLITKKTTRIRSERYGKNKQDTGTSASAPSATERGSTESGSSEPKRAQIAEAQGK